MKNRKLLQGSLAGLLLISSISFNACAPLREFGNSPVYNGQNNYAYPLPAYDSTKKTVVIVANNDGTELFDMMAPYYLFNATEKANVYIVATQKSPVVAKKGLFILPQSTFTEIDSLKIRPDLLVIPFLSVADSLHQDPLIVNWIKSHYSQHVTILSICDGAATAAATGLFDGKPITAHASDYAGIKSHFSKPIWVQNTSVAGGENLYSTAGVSNAVEGSLLVINKLFGPLIMQNVIDLIHYQNLSPGTEHQSNIFHLSDKLTIAKKILFRKNRKIGILLQNGSNEFELAAVMDTYNRTFPGSIHSFSKNDSAIHTKYGLIVIPTGKAEKAKLDELHIVGSGSFSTSEKTKVASTELVIYDSLQKSYIIDQCLSRIRNQYGENYQKIVKLMLDYN